MNEKIVDLRQFLTEELPPELGRAILVPRHPAIGESSKMVHLKQIFDSAAEHNMVNSHRLCDNSPLVLPLSSREVMSAYYTYIKQARVDDSGTITQAVVVEWGKVVGGQRKVHDELRRVIDYNDETRSSLLLRSGHLTSITSTGIHLAYFDVLSSLEINPTASDHPLAKILQENKYLVMAPTGAIARLIDIDEQSQTPATESNETELKINHSNMANFQDLLVQRELGANARTKDRRARRKAHREKLRAEQSEIV